MANSFFNIAIRKLEKAQKALTIEEIWDKSGEWGTREGFESKGKTPATSIGSAIYQDRTQNGDQSQFYQASTSPTKFYLTKYKDGYHEPSEDDNKVQPAHPTRHTSDLRERALHPLLAKFVQSHHHVQATTKTIFHEKSKQTSKGINEWLHPDLVSVRFPFATYGKDVIEIQESLAANSVRLYSFEMKKMIDLPSLRESYFQAVSNSSWAHEGYLVALDINKKDNDV